MSFSYSTRRALFLPLVLTMAASCDSSTQSSNFESAQANTLSNLCGRAILDEPLDLPERHNVSGDVAFLYFSDSNTLNARILGRWTYIGEYAGSPIAQIAIVDTDDNIMPILDFEPLYSPPFPSSPGQSNHLTIFDESFINTNGSMDLSGNLTDEQLIAWKSGMLYLIIYSPAYPEGFTKQLMRNPVECSESNISDLR